MRGSGRREGRVLRSTGRAAVQPGPPGSVLDLGLFLVVGVLVLVVVVFVGVHLVLELLVVVGRLGFLVLTTRLLTGVLERISRSGCSGSISRSLSAMRTSGRGRANRAPGCRPVFAPAVGVQCEIDDGKWIADRGIRVAL